MRRMEKENEIYAAVADALEVACVGAGDDYRKFPLWGSLAAFSLKVTFARKFGCDLGLKELDSFGSAGELARRILG